ncbi:iron complex transport system permease protein [Ochrobactrum sp. P6BSIII]|uniref:Fe(3+)-hydroxamate ABC transporter permease FhuB n=1 Tax=unclassified Ochrobactrum TaxID=239106 RepID=UPI001590AFCB|nr:iron complex transport system permease protein [Ochrobactrum sp. P6BSIII]
MIRLASSSNGLAPLIALALLLSGGLLAWHGIAPDIDRLFVRSTDYDPRFIMLAYSTLPRLVTALIGGAALALAGTLLQQVLRNPLASPTTLGISAGANLALVVTMLAFPTLAGLSRDTVALIGSALAAAIVFLIGARRSFSPFALILSGLIVSVWCGALASILILMNDRYLSGLFIWGAGSLAQQSWSVPLSLIPKVATLSLITFIMARPLALMELGDSGASGLGLSVKHARIAAICLAVALTAVVTSAVGVIGFVGLVAPAITRLGGARTLKSQLIWSPLVGAGLLFLTDEVVQLLANASSGFLPTGAVTALFGAPVLLMLVPRLKAVHRGLSELGGTAGRSLTVKSWLVVLLSLLLLVLILLALFLGREPSGNWAFTGSDLWPEVLPYRIPRVIGAFAAGLMLGVVGTLLQRLMGNEMASPEVLGISAGATMGVAVALFMLPVMGFFAQIGFAAIGALIVLVIIIVLGLRSGFAPERVLLTGIALTAMLDAAVGIIAASGDPRAIILLQWMSGSTYLIETPMALTATGIGLAGLLLTLVMRRWLDMLPLGPVVAQSVGVHVVVARSALLTLAAFLTSAATLVVGPLSFIGLMGPHVARELGLRRAVPQVLGAALAGAGLMVLADWIGRMIAFPYQIPAGLVSALIGTPLLLVLLLQRRRSV